MNSPSHLVISVATKVDVSIGEWTWKVDFMIVWIDDYEVVLGMEFMKQFEAMIVPHLNKLHICDGHDDDPLVYQP